jgi:nucleotide-binding universal stress UspA family protein
MESKVRTILVLWDFTMKAEYAFAHAANLSKITGNDISLLHIVKSENEISEAQKKLAEVSDKLNESHQVKPGIVVLKGNIFKTISNYASGGGVEMVIMGTHGIKGLQKYTGSWAIKVIRGSKVPFLVVQDMPKNEKIENIVFPIDFKNENKEILKWAQYFCRLYRSRIYIVHPVVTDRIFKKRIHSNIVFAQKFFESMDTHFEIKSIGKKIDFTKETIEYAEKVQANLILIIAPKILTLADYIMGPSEQMIIANEAKIPVMVLNPKPRAFTGGFSPTGG